MQGGRGFPRPGHAPKKSSYGTLVIIMCFSVGLLGGYLLLGSPHSAHEAVQAETQSTHLGGRRAGSGGAETGSRYTAKRELLTPSMRSRLSGALQMIHGGGVAAGRDPTQEARKKTMMAQQSSHDENQSQQVNAMKEQMSDKSEHAPATPTVKVSEALLKAQQSDKTEAKTSGGSSGVKATVTELAKAGGITQAGAALSPPPPASQATSAAPAVQAGTTTAAAAWKYTITPKEEKMPANTIHTFFTSNGSPYQNIQARIMVGTWNLVRKMPGGERLVAMTRVMHRTTPDEMMGEIDTFMAQPLQPECDKWCWFPVADRANAMQQWLSAAEKNTSLIKAPWLLLLESDYVWVKPLPDPGDAYDYKNVPGWSFAFDYIAPSHPIVQQILKEKCPTCDPKSVPNSGPAPVMARFSDFKAATPLWEELSKWIETHEEAKKALGWVREMYAWDIGVAAHRLNIRNQGPGDTPLISQPPHDNSINSASMYHYTWGSIFKENDKQIWEFDKRKYTEFEHQMKVPIIPVPPEWHDGIRLQDGLPVTKQLRDTLANMIEMMNKAIVTLPDLRQNGSVAT